MLTEVDRKKLIKLASDTLWNDNSPDVRKVLHYLRTERGLSDSVLKKFQVGYVPLRVRFKISDAVILAGRIITPIFDSYGSPVAISTRTLDKNFWHEAFDKSFHLYGLNFAKKEILRTRKAVVVEGEFDVMYSHSEGVPITVGVCGSAMTPFHANLLARYCDEVYLVFDGDAGKYKQGRYIEGSGQKAAKRALSINENLGTGSFGSLADGRIPMALGMRFIPVYLPIGEDPDDYIKKRGTDSYINLLKDAKVKAQEFDFME